MKNDMKKSTFQDRITKIESELAEYKTSFPKNLGDMFRAGITFICIAFAIYCILSAIAFASFDNIMKAIFVSLSMLYAAVMIEFDSKEKNPENIKLMCDENKPFEYYPDVKKYDDELNAELTRSINEKKGYRKKFKVFFYIYAAILACFIISDFINNNSLFREDLENVHQGDNCGEFRMAAEYFNLKPNEPFVVIKPYDPTFCSDNVELFIVNNNTGEGNEVDDCTAGFRFASLKIKGASMGSQYIMRITDANGQPSYLEYKFKTGTPLVDVDICKSEKEALNICNYLYNHSADLRYTLEKQ